MTTEQIVESIKQCGQSIIDNAASIAGDYRCQKYLNIDITIPVTPEGELPELRVTTEFYPEKWIEENTWPKIKHDNR